MKCILLFVLVISTLCYNCAQYSSCESCIKDPKCGWFSPTGNGTVPSFRCVEGSSFNCNDPICQKPHSYFYDYCPIQDFDDRILKSRRSIRKYLDVPISRDVISEIIEAGVWSPNCMGRDASKFCVINNKEILREISLHSGQSARNIFHDANTAIFVFIKWDKDGECEQFEEFDAGVITQNIELAAYNRGLATCTIGESLKTKLEVRNYCDIRITSGWDFYMGIVLGYPNEKKTSKRNEPNVVWIGN